MGQERDYDEIINIRMYELLILLRDLAPEEVE